MCLSNGPKDDKPRYHCWTHEIDIEESEYAEHDRNGCDIQDMNFIDHK